MSIARWISTASLAGLLALGGCSSTTQLEDVPLFARSHVADDFNSYGVHRVGLMPFQGRDVSTNLAASLESGLSTEIGRATPLEVLVLSDIDLDEVMRSEPYRRGRYDPRTVIELARRYRLDAILFGAVLENRFWPPQRLGISVDMVAAETGLVIWNGTVHLDTSDRALRDGLEIYFARAEEAGANQDNWEVSLLSPDRIARFAAYQIARVL